MHIPIFGHRMLPLARALWSCPGVRREPMR
jgi:hypothetical protein